VISVFILYVRIISFGYGMMEIHRYCGFILTGMHRPVSATALNAVRVLIFLLPLSFLGNRYYGIEGIFTGRLATDWLAGIVGLFWITGMLRKYRRGRKLSSGG